MSVVKRKLAKNKIRQVNDFVEKNEQSRLHKTLQFESKHDESEKKQKAMIVEKHKTEITR